MGSKEDKVYKPYPYLRGRETVSDRPSTQEKKVQSSIEKEITKMKKLWKNTTDNGSHKQIKQ